MAGQQSDTLRVGVLGAGWVATARHIPCFRRVPGVQVEAIFDPDPDRAARVAASFEIPRRYPTADDLLESGLDAVMICTPPWAHASLAIAAMRHGCHVFVEKPMALSVADASEMAAVSAETGRKLCISHNFLFSRSMLRVRRLIDSGAVGDVHHVIAMQLSSPQRRLPTWYETLPGGLFFDESPHLLYLTASIIGAPQVDVARMRPGAPGARQPVANLQALLTGPRGTGTLDMSFDAPVSEWLFTIVGSRKVLVVDLFRDILTVMGSDGSHSAPEVARSSLSTWAQLAMGFATSGVRMSARKLFYGHEVIIERFVQSIRTGSEPPVTPAEGAAVVATMESILRESGVVPA